MRFDRRFLLVGAATALAACSDSDNATGPLACQTNCSATLTGNVATSRTLHADTVYTISGYVKVRSGATLTIEPGTRIVGDAAVLGSSLWILPGAQINAQGTAVKPIVFTSSRAAGSRKPGDWGGILIVGRGKINRTVNPIFTEGPTAQSENYAGGNDNNDNSGTLRYVRIEFAGYDVSNGNGQELNSLSMYAVGRGTTIDYVQSMAGLDDSFEFFGGAVDVRHLVSYESGDDHFDWTEGYSGRGQYLIALQTRTITPDPTAGILSVDPRGFEGDGCELTKSGCTYTNTPFSMPVWANFTVIGPGPGVFQTAAMGDGAIIRRGSGASFVNGVIGRWPEFGVQLRNTESENLRLVDSVIFRNVTLVENGTNFEALNTSSATDPRYGSNLNVPSANFTLAAGTAASLFTSLTPASLDFTPAAGASIRTSGLTTFPAVIAARVGNYFGGTMPATSYQGAADPSGAKWWDGWTAYAVN